MLRHAELPTDLEEKVAKQLGYILPPSVEKWKKWKSRKITTTIETSSTMEDFEDGMLPMSSLHKWLLIVNKQLIFFQKC